VRRIGVAERRARLCLRHRLVPARWAEHPVEVARDLVGLHGTEPASVFVAVWARTRSTRSVAVERALYDERTLTRMLGMRGTQFVVPVELAPVVQAACGRPSAARSRRKLVEQLGRAGIAEDPARWLAEIEQSTLRALAARGEATAVELAGDEPRLREHVVVPGPPDSALRQPVAVSVLLLLAAEGRVVRTRPLGSWINNQYRWAPTTTWFPDGVAHAIADPNADPSTADARVELVRRWLAAFGPGTVADLRWWTGWTTGEVTRALSRVGTVEVDLDGVAGLLLADDVEPAPAVEPSASLLATLDSTVMGWSDRHWYLGDHRSALFDHRGNGGPTVWWDGRVVGGWAQRRGGEIVFRLLEDAGADAVAAVEAAAQRLGDWLGTVRITPRFRTPLERELCS